MLTLVLVAVVTLGQRSARLRRLTNERMVATYLAREGIELTRSLRDDNWFLEERGAGFIPTPTPPPPPPVPPTPLPNPIHWRGRLPSDRTALCTPGGRATYRTDSDIIASLGLEARDPSAPDLELRLVGLAYKHDASGTATRPPFRRLITLEATDDCGDASAYSPPNTPPNPLTVRATVVWDDSGANPTVECPPERRRTCVELVEILYPWLRSR